MTRTKKIAVAPTMASLSHTSRVIISIVRLMAGSVVTIIMVYTCNGKSIFSKTPGPIQLGLAVSQTSREIIYMVRLMAGSVVTIIMVYTCNGKSIFSRHLVPSNWGLQWRLSWSTPAKQNRSTEGCSKLKSPKTGEIGLDNGTHASPKVGQDQVSGGVGVLCWNAAPVANVQWKQKRSTEGCSKFKGRETRQVQEKLVSTLEHMQVPKWDRTRCPEE